MSGNLPTRLTGNALASAAGTRSGRVARRTEHALNQLQHQADVSEAAVQARARLIGQANSAAMRTAAAVHLEGQMLAELSPAAARALEAIAMASTVGLTNIVIDASE